MKIGLLRSTLLIVALIATAAQAKELPSVRLSNRTIQPQPDLSVLDRAAEESGGDQWFLVQLAHPFAPAARTELGVLGVELDHYIPDHTWIARFSERAMTDQMVRGRLQWVGEILPEYKMPARLRDGEIGPWAIELDGWIRLRVRFHDGVDIASARGKIQSLGAEPREGLPIYPGLNVVATPDQLESIASLDEVLWITEALPPPQNDNDGSRARTGVDVLTAPPYGLSGLGIHVGMTDGGEVDETHDDFEGRLTNMEIGSTSNHATHVAGTFVGSGQLSASRGGAPLQWRGVAPMAEIYALDYQGDVITEIISGIQAYDWSVHNNSWGFGVNQTNCDLYGNYDLLTPEYDELVSGVAGKRIPIVFSAGNERDDGDCPLIGDGYGSINPPKAGKNTIAVGATYSDTDEMTTFSSWGPVDDGRIKPDLCAPGDEMVGDGYIVSTLPVDDYGGPAYQGTSMSAPVVSGILTLLCELYERENPGVDPEPSLLKGLLIANAVDLGNPGPDFAFGHGRVSGPEAAAAMLFDTQYVFEVEHGEVIEYAFHVPVGNPSLRVALVWDDPAAVPLADPALINNLDLVLICPDMVEHHPWVLDPSNPELTAATGVDSVNNVEHLEVVASPAGMWTARITGTNVPEGPQLASLVGVDLKAPAAPIDFAVVDSTLDTIDLDWDSPEAADRKATLVLRSEQTIAWTPIDGESYVVDDEVEPGLRVIYLDDRLEGSGPITDSGLEEGTWYHYAAFTFDDMHNYSAAAVDSGLTNVAASVEPNVGAPTQLTLHPARPNPAGGQTRISFDLPNEAPTQLRIFDPTGRLVRTLIDARLPAGSYHADWYGRDDAYRRVASGVYFYALRRPDRKIARQLLWMRSH